MDAQDTLPKVTILGKEHNITLPDFTAREELFHAYVDSGRKKGNAIFRVFAGAIGLCTRIGRENHANVSYADCRFDVLDYGGKVYSYLREKEVSHEEIATQGKVILDRIQLNLFPRAAEVEEARGK